MAETLADLLHEAGIDYSGAATQIAEQTPYTPSTPLRRPTPGPSAREAQRRMLLGAPKDVAQAGRNYQQNYVSQLRDGRLPDAVRDLPGQALELTGLPSFRRAGRAAASGDLPTAALETGMGALGVVGMGAAIRPAVRPLLGAARAPAEAAAVVADDGLGQFHRPMLSRYGANDRGGPERVRAALRNDLSDPHGRPLNDERDTLSLGPYQYWWGRRYVNGRDIGPPRNPAPEQLGEAGVPPRDPVGSARAQWDLDPNDPILRGSPDIAADPATTLRGAAMRPRGPMRSQSLPNEDRRWPAFGAPAESPQRIPRAIQPQTRASDGTILPAQPRETFGRPFRRTATSSGDLREAAQTPALPDLARPGQREEWAATGLRNNRGYEFRGPKDSRYGLMIEEGPVGAELTLETRMGDDVPQYGRLGMYGAGEARSVFRRAMAGLERDMATNQRPAYTLGIPRGLKPQHRRIFERMAQQQVRANGWPGYALERHPDGELVLRRVQDGPPAK